MKKVLVVGNSNSIWIKEYVSKVHKKLGNEVFLTVFDKPNERYAEEYKIHDIKMINLFDSKILPSKIYKALKLIKVALTENRIKKFDVIDIQSPPHSFQAKVLTLLCRLINTRTIVTFWGSDLMRISKNDSNKVKGILDNSEKINLATKALKDKFREYYGNAYDHKITGAVFGSLAFDDIDKYVEDKKNAKERFGLNPNKITVAVGYNGNKEQQHVLAIDALSKLNDYEKSKIELILHLGYGLPVDYLSEIKQAVNNSSISCKILLEMYDLETIGKLRAATDIMIHAQTTDALSGTIRECIYAGAVLINPIWIKYKEFDNLGIDYIQYNSFNKLTDTMRSFLDGKLKINTEKNRAIMYNNFSWNGTIEKWMEMFDEGTC